MSEPRRDAFSKVRIETLCDGIFAIAMTLLVLELKVPDLPRTAAAAEIWRALGEHGGAFAGFALTFVLAGQFWLLHHQFFHRLQHANRALALLTIPYLLFVSLLPFSTSLLTAFTLRNPVALTFYCGNQLALAVLLAAQWVVAKRGRLFADEGADGAEWFGLALLLQPASFALSLGVVFVAPSQTFRVMAITQLFIAAIAQRRRRQSDEIQRARSVPGSDAATV